MRTKAKIEQDAQVALQITDLSDRAFAPRAILSWPTASGRKLPHIAYSLIGCPALALATYLLVRRDNCGRMKVLAIRRTNSEAPSLNLARIRNEGAKLGANEVHVHVLGNTASERAELALDLALAHLPHGRNPRLSRAECGPDASKAR